MECQRILITGSEGKIGKILVKALDDSFDIYGLDIQEKKDKKYFQADISNLEELDRVFKKIGDIDCIIHLAADSRVDADWESILRNNIIGTRNVYECARIYRVKKIIFASSNHVTGVYEGFPPSLHKEDSPVKITVDDPIRPDSDYGLSKASGEAFAREYFELYGIKSICLRIGSVLESDDPTKDERIMKTWLSHRDLVQLVRKSLISDINFGIYYGVSNNKGRFWDISNAGRELGYKPKDNAFLVK